MTSSSSQDRNARAAAELPAPDRVPTIDGELAGLSHAGPARAAAVLVEGERCSVLGVGGRPGFRVEIGGRLVATVSLPDLGTAANVLCFPGVVRRDFVGPGGSCVETLLAAPSLPLVVAQWRRATGGSPGPIIVDREADDVAVCMSPPPQSEEETSQGSDRPWRTSFVPADSDLTSLVIAAGAPEAVRASLAAARHAPAHAVRAAAGPEEGLLLDTGLPNVDDGVRWLRVRLAAQLQHAARSAVDENVRLPLALAVLSVGDREGVEALLATGLGGGGADPAGADVGAAAALIAARFAAVFGDVGHAVKIARLWVGGNGGSEGTAGIVPGGSPLTGLAAEALADALHRSEHPRTIAALRALAADARSAHVGSPGSGPGEAGPSNPGPPASERALPMAGTTASGRSVPTVGASPAASDSSTWWRALISGEPAPPAAAAARAEIARARQVTASFRTDPDSAWIEWRELVDAPFLNDGPYALWDAPDDLRSDVGTPAGSLTAELLLALTGGLLGIEADAPAGRIRIAPRIPGHLSRFGVGGIRVGPCTIRMRYERSHGVHRFEIEPERAPVPPLVVFEPAVMGEVTVVRVDGEEATLDPRPSGQRTVVPAQLPVDARRCVEIQTE